MEIPIKPNTASTAKIPAGDREGDQACGQAGDQACGRAGGRACDRTGDRAGWGWNASRAELGGFCDTLADIGVTG
jgi:hypothetical protein